MEAAEVRAGGGVVARDGEAGLEVIVVHRPRYDDWSLPKGKLEPGEAFEEGALREVEEETGFRCELGDELSPISYRDRKGRLKLVRYWVMSVVSGGFAPNEEVDELEWLPLAAAAERIAVARAERAFSDVADLARRAGLHRGDLRVLAAADALQGHAGHRHLAAWQVAGGEQALPIAGLAHFNEQLPLLRPPDAGQAVLADYAQTGLTLREHPLALIRAQLRARGLLSSREVAARAPGEIVRAAGLVLIRQRPGNGRAIFVTLEDEYGGLNLLIWADLAERQRRVLLGSQLLGVVAEIQRAEGVQHLVCRRLENHSDLLGELRVVSRDFH